MRQAIQTDRAPQAIGPYSQAVRAGDLLFVSGQIPLDPSTGELVNGDIREQTERVMQNLREILEAAGVSFDRVVRTTIFLADLVTSRTSTTSTAGSSTRPPLPAQRSRSHDCRKTHASRSTRSPSSPKRPVVKVPRCTEAPLT